MTPGQNRRRRRSQGGNAFIEMSLGFLPFFALIFGILDFSLAIFVNNTLQEAAREGVRYAITYNTTYKGTSYASQTLAIQAVVESNSMGFLTTSNGTSYVKVNYYLPNDLSTPAKTSDLPKTVNNVYIQYLNQTGNVVEVQVNNFPWNWMVPLGGYMPGKSLTMSSAASDVLQSYPVGTFSPPSP
jgi:Flp pilus assembly protein TadG